MNRNKRPYVSPIYIFVIVWLICTFALPLFKLIGLLLSIGIAAGAAVAVGKFLQRKYGETKAEKEAREAAEAAEKAKKEAEEAAQKAKEAAESKYSPEVNAIIKDGRVALAEMSRLRQSIPNKDVKEKIDEICVVSDKIVRDAIDDPSDVPQIRKFLDYYLPTTIKLLNAYDRMGSQGVEGENITGSMQSIESMLDTTIAAYKKQLDALFANQANDIQTDIEVLNSLLAREGLGGKSYLDLKDFMKQYNQEKQNKDKEQKGTTANG